MYLCDYYYVMTTYNLDIPVMIRLHVPASRGFFRCLHTCDIHAQGPRFQHTYVTILPMNTHIPSSYKNIGLYMHLPFPYVRSQPRLYSYLLHPPEHVLMCECLP